MQNLLDDIVFESRNKEYGSYRIRKRYFSRLLISLLISVSTMTLITLGYFLYLNTDNGNMVYLMPSAYPGLKSTQGSLLDPEELAAYYKGPDPASTAESTREVKPPADPLHNFDVTDEASPDTFKQHEEEKPEPEGGSILGLESDSTVFGGYLLGGGEGTGTGSGLDKFPEFPGGPDGVRRYIELTVVYPALAIKQKINGVVILSFDVNKLGEIDNIKVERSVNPMLDQEAIKAIKNMPRWKPGLRYGKPVIVKFVIPVRFMPVS